MNMERKTGLMNKKYVSPCFLPGMRLGNIMFTLAAVLITIWSIDTLREKMDRLP